MVQLSTLRNVAIAGAFISLGSGFYFQRKIQQGFRHSQYYQQSISLFKQNRAAVNLLGEPIRDGYVDLSDTERNFADGVTARLCVPLKGSKAKGCLYLWASRKELQTAWDIDRLELALDDEPIKRLLIYGHKKE